MYLICRPDDVLRNAYDLQHCSNVVSESSSDSANGVSPPASLRSNRAGSLENSQDDLQGYESGSSRPSTISRRHGIQDDNQTNSFSQPSFRFVGSTPNQSTSSVNTCYGADNNQMSNEFATQNRNVDEASGPVSFPEPLYVEIAHNLPYDYLFETNDDFVRHWLEQIDSVQSDLICDLDVGEPVFDHDDDDDDIDDPQLSRVIEDGVATSELNDWSVVNGVDATIEIPCDMENHHNLPSRNASNDNVNDSDLGAVGFSIPALLLGNISDGLSVCGDLDVNANDVDSTDTGLFIPNNPGQNAASSFAIPYLPGPDNTQSGLSASVPPRNFHDNRDPFPDTVMAVDSVFSGISYELPADDITLADANAASTRPFSGTHPRNGRPPTPNTDAEHIPASGTDGLSPVASLSDNDMRLGSALRDVIVDLDFPGATSQALEQRTNSHGSHVDHDHDEFPRVRESNERSNLDSDHFGTTMNGLAMFAQSRESSRGIPSLEIPIEVGNPLEYTSDKSDSEDRREVCTVRPTEMSMRVWQNNILEPADPVLGGSEEILPVAANLDDLPSGSRQAVDPHGTPRANPIIESNLSGSVIRTEMNDETVEDVLDNVEDVFNPVQES